MTADDNGILLGDTYKDNITGFTGTATAITRYLHSCNRVLLEANGLNTEGKEVAVWADDQRLIHVATDTQVEATTKPGGPNKTPPSRDPS